MLHTSRQRAGFSLIEALISVTLTTMACAALVNVVHAVCQTSSIAIHSTVAAGLARQLMDEISLARFPRTTDTRPGPVMIRAVPGRAEFNDLDDYTDYVQSPPADREGWLLGSLALGQLSSGSGEASPMARVAPLDRFVQEVVVERLQAGSGGTWQVVTTETGLRRVTVRIRELAGPSSISRNASNGAQALPGNITAAPIVAQNVRIMAYVPPAQ
jgi:hypothetical protein